MTTTNSNVIEFTPAIDLIRKLDHAIITLYPIFDFPADRLVADADALTAFAKAVDDASEADLRHLWGTTDFQNVLRKRILDLRRGSAVARRSGKPNLARLGRRWEGPNYLALSVAVGEGVGRNGS